jgi:arylsulfatase A-like enzyme
VTAGITGKEVFLIRISLFRIIAKIYPNCQAFAPKYRSSSTVVFIAASVKSSLNQLETSFSTFLNWQVGFFRVIALLAIVSGCTPTLLQLEDEGKSKPKVSPASYSKSSGSPSSKPNIILINLDDADCDVVYFQADQPDEVPRYLPNFHRLATEGLRLNNFHVSVPICNPSRVSLYTGQYAHKTGVRCNAPQNPSSLGVPGGFLPFRYSGPFGDRSQPYVNNELGSWMKEAGYVTMHVGKYLHDQFEAQPGENLEDIIPRGWTDFYGSFGATYFRTMFYKNGKYSFCHSSDAGRYGELYRGVIERVDIQELVEERLQKPEQPFFLYYAPLAPHREDFREFEPLEQTPDLGMVQNRYKGDLPDLKQVRGPNYNLADNSDRPFPIRSMDLLRDQGDVPLQNDQWLSDLDYRRRILSLKTVDDTIGEIFELLEKHSATENTLIILTSDHGYVLGQFRHIGKSIPYDRVTKVPTIAWGPGLVTASPGVSDHLLSNIDIAPTMLDLAGADIPTEVQGHSFRAVLSGTVPTRGEWRPEGILVEHWERVHARPQPAKIAYAAVRLHDQIFTQWYTGEEEFYDLAKDPLQLKNQIDELDEAQRAELRGKLQALRSEMPHPELFISTPFFGNDVFYREVLIEGLFEYKQPLLDVELQITTADADQSDGQPLYWDGTNWKNETHSVSATLASHTSLITGWNYAFSPPLDWEQKDFIVTAIGTAVDGTKVRRSVSKPFSIRRDFPLAQIDTPDRNQVAKLNRNFRIAGSATDDERIREIAIVIEDRDSNRFWNGQEWQTDSIDLPTQISARRENRVEWFYEFSPTERDGEVFVTVKVIPTPRKPARPTLPATPILWSR